MSADRPGEPKKERQEPEPRERTVAPPIEREHETQEGVSEEGQRKRERENSPPEPKRS